MNSRQAAGTEMLTRERCGETEPRSRVRVLHINGGNLYGGVENFLVTLARFRQLCPEMEPHFALCYAGRCSQELIEAGVSVFDLGAVRFSRPWTVWRARRRLREFLRREHFDMVVCHMPWAHAVFGKVVRAESQKLAFWAHGFHTGSGWLERLARRTTPDVAIINSYFTAQGVKKLFHNVPSQVLYYPVALSEPEAAAQWRAPIRAELEVPRGTAVIIQVSRLEAWKGHLLHLRALSLLKDAGPWVCWIVGGPQKPEEEEYLSRLRRSAAELGIADRVRFLGQRSDVPRLLAGADIFCQPNEGAEPFGIVFIEAFRAGLPVVSTAMGGAIEIVDPSCGLLVEPGDADLLAAALRRLIESPEMRRELAQAGAPRASQLCDPQTQIQAIADVARRMAGEERGAA